MPKLRPKAIPSLKGGVFAHDPSAIIAAVNVDGGVLSWLDVASVIDRVPHLFHLDKFPEGANPGPVIPAVKVYLMFWGTAWLATPRPVPYSADIINAVSTILYTSESAREAGGHDDRELTSRTLWLAVPCRPAIFGSGQRCG